MADRRQQAVWFHISRCSLFTNIKNYKVSIMVSLLQNVSHRFALLTRAQVQKIYFTYLKYSLNHY